MTAFLRRLWAQAKGLIAGIGIGAALAVALSLIIGVNWFGRDGAGTAAAAPSVVVAGESALTDKADDWTKGELRCPPAEPGKPEIKIVYRDPDPAEVERLAREYAATFVTVDAPEEIVVDEPERRKRKAPAARPFRIVFGEYAYPESPYGGRFLPGIGDDGEFQAIFNLDGPPKARWTNVWGFGVRGEYGEDGLGEQGAYAFWEPGQVKQVHFRLEAGGYESDGETELRTLFSAEWRAEPWRRKAGEGLKAVRVE